MVKIALNQPLKRRKKGWSLKLKATAWAIAITTLPILSFGTAIYWLGNRSLEQYLLKARQAGIPDIVENVLILERELLALMIGTAVTIILVSISTVWFTNRAIRPIIGVAQITSNLVNRLFRANVSIRERLALRDEIALIKTNISLIEEQLPNVLWQSEAHTERYQILLKITRSIQECLSEKDIFRTAVEEMRLTLKADRVSIFSFDENWEGTFVEESVAPAWPKALWATIHDPCFEVNYVKKYLHGRACAIDNIYDAGLSDCHIGLLERFAVKSNLVAPIVKNNQLFGLLIAHQCARPRNWQQVEIDLFGQVAMQIGFTLERIWRTNQLEQNYQQATNTVRQKIEQQELLQQKLSHFLEQNQAALNHLGTETPKQIDLITKAYNQIKEVADASRGVFVLERQLGLDTEQIKSMMRIIDTQTQQLSATIHPGIAKSDDYSQLIGLLQPKLDQLNLVSVKMKTLLDEIAQSAAQVAPALDCASQLILEVARIAKQNAEQSTMLAKSVQELEGINQQLSTHTQKTNPINIPSVREEYYKNKASNGYKSNSIHTIESQN